MKQKILKELKRMISQRYSIVEMRLFGSSARGEANVHSDLDVLVVLEYVNSSIEMELYDLAYDIELKFNCLIDLVVVPNDHNKAIPLYKNAFAEGIPI